MLDKEIDTQLYNYAVNYLPAKVATLLVAQARFESADYSSNVFIKNNNLFGYKWVNQSGATQGSPAPSSEGGPPYYAKYESKQASIKELIGWLNRRQKEGKLIIAQLVTPAAYAAALKACSYYQSSSSHYSDGLAAKLSKMALPSDVSPSQGINQFVNSTFDGWLVPAMLAVAAAGLIYWDKLKKVFK